ncbi:hypothetical protein M758_10G138400 [Ceratodon purpureus]|nr:hypothetical protein M758_10G138400 [Ceratodon purpureus]
MDSLLASYASDEEDDREEEEEDVKPLPAVKASLFGRLPPPRNPSAGVSSGALPPARSLVKVEDVGDGAAGESRSGLFGKLPPPKVERFGGNPNDEGLGFGVGAKASLFAALPAPRVGFERVKVEEGSGNGSAKVKKQVVAFKPPIDVSVLEDDDDDWRPAQKRVKKEVESVVKGAGGLQALLPAPKNSLGLGSALGGGGGGGGRRAAMEVAARTEDVKAEPLAVNSRVSVSAAAPEVKREGLGSQGRVQYDNSAYAVDESAAFAPQIPYSNEAYGWTAPQGAYAPADEKPQSVHNVNSHYEQQNWQYTGNASHSSQSSQASYAPASSEPVSDPVAQVLQAERRRGREDKMAAPTIIEVKQADLTGGKVREDQLRSTGIAFGPSYQPVSSSKDKPSKIQRRKHQIGTLLHDMKAREMELLDRRAKGNLTKAETQAKYGW